MQYRQFEHEQLEERDRHPYLLVSEQFDRSQFWFRGVSLTQALGGLVCLAVGALYITNSGALSTVGVPFWSGAYFAATGIVALLGTVSYRRGLIVASMVFCIHSLVIFTPLMILSGVAGIYMDKNSCWLNCTVTTAWDCRFACDSAVDPTWADYKQNYAAGRADLGIMCMGVVQGCLALLSLWLSTRAVCESYGAIDSRSLRSVYEYTMYSNRSLNVLVDKKSSLRRPLISQPQISVTAESIQPATIVTNPIVNGTTTPRNSEMVVNHSNHHHSNGITTPRSSEVTKTKPDEMTPSSSTTDVLLY